MKLRRGWHRNWFSFKPSLDFVELGETTLFKSIHRVLVVVHVDEVLFTVGVAPKVLVKFDLLYLLNAVRVG